MQGRAVIVRDGELRYYQYALHVNSRVRAILFRACAPTSQKGLGQERDL